jgi:tRNA dimethylallyltransferase
VPSPDDALLTIVGPTASGKTELAVRWGQELGAEIVNADSVQVYRRFDLGSGKPTPLQRVQVVHQLVDIVDPLDPMDAARWASLAEQTMADLRARGGRSVLCGGTFLWIRALVSGLAPAPPADPGLRARHRTLAAEHGRAFLHAALGRVDPESAGRLAPNDLVRVSRALEVYELTGRPLSSWQAEHGFRPVRYPTVLVGIRHSSAELDRRITARVQAMLDSGLVEEIRALLEAGYGTARAMRSVGYRQVADWLTSGRSLDRDKLAEEMVRATRIFARRQRTWLRDRPVIWLTAEEARTLSAAEVLDR